jgi:hypothetical protein
VRTTEAVATCQWAATRQCDNSATTYTVANLRTACNRIAVGYAVPTVMGIDFFERSIRWWSCRNLTYIPLSSCSTIGMPNHSAQHPPADRAQPSCFCRTADASTDRNNCF